MIRALILILLIGSISMTTFAGGTERIEITDGQQKSADRGRLTIKFVEIIEDSRCPPEVNCIWAGNAKIKIAVSKGKAGAKFFELNTGVTPQAVTTGGYEITLESMTQNNPERLAGADCPLVATFSVKKIG